MRGKMQAWAGRMIMLALIAVFMVGFAYTVPADLALLAAIDMATYGDVLFGVYVVARLTRLRPMLAYLRIRIGVSTRRMKTRVRSIRIQPSKPADLKSAANDDDPAWALAA